MTETFYSSPRFSLSLPRPVGSYFKFVPTDEDGTPLSQSVTFMGTFDPMSYAELLSIHPDRNPTLAVTMSNARIVESANPDLPVGKECSFTSKAACSMASQTYGLVKGGWLPSGMGLDANMLILPDRCTVTALKSRYADGVRKDDGKPADFLDFLVQGSIRINPMLLAVEGNTRTSPTHQVAEQQVMETCGHLRRALPQAIIIQGTEFLRGVFAYLNATAERVEQEKAFLLRINPLLHAPIGAARIRAVWRQVLTIADDMAIARASLVLMAVLSSILVPNGQSPAKKVLKFQPAYTAEDAYNAVADLRSLEMLMVGFALAPSEPMMLCTNDKNLALFWTGLRADDFSLANAPELHFTTTPDDHLFPGLTDEDRQSLRELT